MPPPRSWIRTKRSVLVAGAVLMAVAQALFIGLKLPGPRRSRTAGQADWLSEVKRIHPKTVWGKSGIDSLLGPKPQPCPYKLLAYHDWAGAQTNNVILALANALYLSRVTNRTLVLSDAAALLMSTVFDVKSINSHFCVVANTSLLHDGQPGKVVHGRGVHGGQDMFRLLPPPGVRPALLGLILLQPNARIRNAVELCFEHLIRQSSGKPASRPEGESRWSAFWALRHLQRPIVGVHIRGLDGDCRNRARTIRLPGASEGEDRYCAMETGYVLDQLEVLAKRFPLALPGLVPAQADSAHYLAARQHMIRDQVSAFVAHDAVAFVRALVVSSPVPVDLQAMKDFMAGRQSSPWWESSDAQYYSDAGMSWQHASHDYAADCRAEVRAGWISLFNTTGESSKVGGELTAEQLEQECIRFANASFFSRTYAGAVTVDDFREFLKNGSLLLGMWEDRHIGDAELKMISEAFDVGGDEGVDLRELVHGMVLLHLQHGLSQMRLSSRGMTRQIGKRRLMKISEDIARAARVSEYGNVETLGDGEAVQSIGSTPVRGPPDTAQNVWSERDSSQHKSLGEVAELESFLDSFAPAAETEAQHLLSVAAVDTNENQEQNTDYVQAAEHRDGVGNWSAASGMLHYLLPGLDTSQGGMQPNSITVEEFCSSVTFERYSKVCSAEGAQMPPLGFCEVGQATSTAVDFCSLQHLQANGAIVPQDFLPPPPPSDSFDPHADTELGVWWYIKGRVWAGVCSFVGGQFSESEHQCTVYMDGSTGDRVTPPPPPPALDGYTDEEKHIIDLLLLAFADFVIGNPASTLTTNALLLRLFLEKPAGTSSIDLSDLGCYGTREPPFEFERFVTATGDEDWRCRDGVVSTANVSWYTDNLQEGVWHSGNSSFA